MAADNTISLQLKVQDDGSVVMEKFQVNAQEAFRKVETASNSLLGKMKNHWVEMAAAAYGAWHTISEAWHLAEEAAGYMEQMTALDNLAAKYNTTAQSIVQSLQQAANGQISQAEAMHAASKSMMEGMNPDQLVKFMQMTTALTNVTGQKVGEAFEAVSQALATGRTRALHQMGIIVDLNKAYDNYAAKLGVTSDHLTEHAKQVAGVDAVLKQYDATIQKLGSAPESIDDKMEKFISRLKDIKLLIGEGLIRGFAGLYWAISMVGIGLNTVVGTVASGWGQLLGLFSNLPKVGEYFKTASDGLLAYSERLKKFKEEALKDASTAFDVMLKIGDNAQKKAGGLKIGGGKDPLVESSAKALLEFHQTITKEITDIQKGGYDEWLGLALDYHKKEEELRIAAGARTIEDLQRMARTNSGIKRDLADIELRFSEQVAAKLREDAKKLSEARIEIAAKEMEQQLSIRAQLNQYQLQAGDITEVEGVKRKYEIERETLSLKQKTLVEQMAIETDEKNLVKLAGEYLDIQDKIKASKQFQSFDTQAAIIKDMQEKANIYKELLYSKSEYAEIFKEIEMKILDEEYAKYLQHVTNKAALDDWYAARKYKIQLDSQAKEKLLQQLSLSYQAQVIQTMQNGLNAYSQSAGKNAELVFYANKALALASIWVSTGQAAMAAAASSAILGPVAAEAAAASMWNLGYANMAIVAATALAGPGGGNGGGGGSSPGASAGPSNQNNGYKYFDYQQTQYGTGWKPGEGQGPGVTINIHGDVYDKAAFDKKVINVVDQNIKDNGSTKKVIQRYV